MTIGKKIFGSLGLATMVWGGMTAYISSNTESQLEAQLRKSNQLYSTQGMKLSLVEFEKGFTSSQAKVSLDFINPEMKEALSKTLNLPLVMDYNIENGPVLLKNGLNVGASRINSTINVSKLFKDQAMLKSYIKEDIIVTSNSIIDFSKNMNYIASTNEILITNPKGEEYRVAPLNIEGRLNTETFVGNLKMITKSIDGKLVDGGRVEMRDITLDGDITKFFDNGFYLGDFNFKIDALSMQDKNIPFVIKNSKVLVATNITQNSDKSVNLDVNMDLDVGESQLPSEMDIAKKFSLKYGIDGVKLEGLLAFQDTMKEIQTKQQEVMAKLTTAKTDEEQMLVFSQLEELNLELSNKMGQLLTGLLLKDKSKLNLKLLLTDKSNKESDVSFNLGYIGDEKLPKNMDELKKKFQQELLNWVTLDLKLNLKKSLIQNLPQNLQQEVGGQLQMGTMMGMIKDNNSSYSFDVNYKSKKLTINGEDKSDMLPMVEMGLQQGAM